MQPERAIRVEVEIKQPPSLKQWLKALLAALWDADASATTGTPPVAAFDPSSGAKARVVVRDGVNVIANAPWSYNLTEVEAEQRRIALITESLTDDDVRKRARDGRLVTRVEEPSG